MSISSLGYTTGTCATAAVKAAITLLDRQITLSSVSLTLPEGEEISLPIVFCRMIDSMHATAAVKKYAGDDPDVTDSVTVVATVGWAQTGELTFLAGEGVGTVTLPGLSVGIGEPAINPVPRSMITKVVREITNRPVDVCIGIPGGELIAKKTFNARLGIVGGLSILGTTGRVRPFSAPALRKALACSFDVAEACGITAPVLVPGNIGRNAALRHFKVTAQQVIEVSNEWGFMLDKVMQHSFKSLLAMGHPGKLIKLAGGDWDTHSSRSQNPMKHISRILNCDLDKIQSQTVEGFFSGLTDSKRASTGAILAQAIGASISLRTGNSMRVAVCIIAMSGEILGSHGDLQLWHKK